jgi:hypothetical protein
MRKWVRSIVGRYEIESHHFKILVLAAEAWDSFQKARLVIAKKGFTYLDRFDAPRARPEIAIARDSRIAFVRCLRELALENEDPEAATPRPRVAPRLPKKDELWQ